jgi:hypothetical protein
MIKETKKTKKKDLVPILGKEEIHLKVWLDYPFKQPT